MLKSGQLPMLSHELREAATNDPNKRRRKTMGMLRQRKIPQYGQVGVAEDGS